MNFDLDSLRAIPGITSISLHGNIEPGDCHKISAFLDQNPKYIKNLRQKSFQKWYLLTGKPLIIERLLSKLAEFGINISTKILIINSVIDTGLIIDAAKIQNMVDDPPEELKQFDMVFSNDISSKLRIGGKFSSALLFSSGRILLTTGRGKDHAAFQNEIIRGISACNFAKKTDGDLLDPKQ